MLSGSLPTRDRMFLKHSWQELHILLIRGSRGGREVAPAAYRIGTRRGPTKGDPASISVTKRYLEPLTLGGLIKEVWLDVPTGQTKVCVMVRYQ